jgi:hypothetical protein
MSDHIDWKGQMCKFFRLSVEIAEGLNLQHKSPTCGLPGCIMQPTAAFVSYVYTKKITQ